MVTDRTSVARHVKSVDEVTAPPARARSDTAGRRLTLVLRTRLPPDGP